MGFAKEQQLQDSYRGFTSGEKAICPDHIPDEALKRHIQDYASEEACSFCPATGTKGEPIAAAFEDFMSGFMVGVHLHYRRANDEGAPFEGGEFQIKHFDSDEVAEEMLYAAMQSFDIDDSILDEIQECMVEDAWVKSDWQRIHQDEAMLLTWSRFKEKVKYETRFLFMTDEKESEYDPEEISVIDFFKRLSNILFQIDGVWRQLDKGSELYRGRMFEEKQELSALSGSDLGSPPREKAAANRMSPAGISMFYGGDSYATAVAEISAHSESAHAIVGKFKTVKDNMVIDLSRLPELPSSFNKDARDEYYILSFLRQFAKDLAQPIVLDGREHIDYVPTQIFTEYLRLEPAYPVHGLVFNSTQCAGQNTVIFCGRDA
ncbi:HEPN-associated N-terminal domain-containing protein, partial [Rhodococcus sp. LB1]|uniref:HEPN-associated N-terminal domain-containing protein n=1 Tax=Rhodococcus sp. LB1 TaxID=1807499 RepID=UPI00077B1292